MQVTLIVSSEFPPGPGGIGQHAKSLALTLSQKDKVFVLCNQDYSSLEEIRKHNSGLPTSIEVMQFVLRKSVLTPVKRLMQTISLIKKIEPNKIIVSGRFPLWIGGLLKIRFSSINIIAFAHGTEVSISGGLLARLTHISLKQFDHVYAVSNFTAKYLTDAGLSNISVLPNGLDDEFLKLLKEKKVDLLWKGAPKLLTVGNLTNRKGQHNVIRALPRLLSQYPDLHYHMVGLPTNKESLLKLANSLGVSSSITIHGRLNSRIELVNAFKNAEVFIMLSENQPNGDVEGFGIAILEANAVGLPTIGAIGCGIEDAINETSGVLVDGNSREEILNALDWITNNYSSFSEGALKWAQKHNWNTLAQNMNDEFKL